MPSEKSKKQAYIFWVNHTHEHIIDGDDCSCRKPPEFCDFCKHNIEILAMLLDEVQEDALSLLSTIRLNARLIPDPSMNGTTDCYAVPCDDIEAIDKMLKRD